MSRSVHNAAYSAKVQSMLLLILSTMLFSASSNAFQTVFSTNPPLSSPSRVTNTALSSQQDAAVDPNEYNVNLEEAADLWTVSVSPENSLDRVANVPFLDCKSKDYFVDDVAVEIKRAMGESLGLELLELAGGRNDGYGLTIVEGASGNAGRVGVLAGDAVASVEIRVIEQEEGNSLSSKERINLMNCECRDFDATIEVLSSIPAEIETITLNLKRVRRWPRIDVVVEYPPSQCADGVENTETLRLFAGENLRQALLNRRIIMEDPLAGKCDFCGGKCIVKVDQGMPLLNPMSLTEEKIMKRNPKCRLSCKATVGHNMQEGNIRLKVNLGEWNRDDTKRSSNLF